MKFFFPDSQDFVDASFDFRSETRSENRVRQRDDLYPHEVFYSPPYDGILVSKAVVDGLGGGTGRYTTAQRQRFLRVGVREYFRFNNQPLESMGDCGAFTYVKELRPPYSAAEVADFYHECGFDYGLSVDHVILSYKEALDSHLPGVDLVPKEWRERQDITLQLAEEFFSYHKSKKLKFTPVGIAQGWSPDSYAQAVDKLQAIGYRYIAFGGFVPLKTQDILACLAKAGPLRREGTVFHLLGITRCEQMGTFTSHGVCSFDSTTPLRQAFKDDKNNYYTKTKKYTAIRVPQVDANPSLVRRITAGRIQQEHAHALEKKCLQALVAYDENQVGLDEVLLNLQEYEKLNNGQSDHTTVYRQILEDRPWKDCPCEVCREIGIHVVIFRGAERNRRRGFHNLFVFYQVLQNERARTSVAEFSTYRGS